MSRDIERQKKILESKMLLDSFEIPNRPRAMSAHQYKKKHGSNIGYSAYKADIQQQRKQWDQLYKNLQKIERLKGKYLSDVDLSDEAMAQAEKEARESGISVGEVLARWIERGRQSD